MILLINIEKIGIIVTDISGEYFFMQPLFNKDELFVSWEDGFYDGDWKVNTLHLTDFEKSVVESLTEALPRHMPVYDWNLPYAEGIILILRREYVKKVFTTK